MAECLSPSRSSPVSRLAPLFIAPVVALLVVAAVYLPEAVAPWLLGEATVYMHQRAILDT